MKQVTFLLRLLVLGLILALTSSTQAQVIIDEVQYVGTDRVELRNIGTTNVDITNWWICHLFSYSQISSLSVTGNLDMAPGDITVISGFSLNGTSSDFGIYSSASFGSSAAMQDFVQWGAGGQGRESVAVAKGIWTAGDFVPTVAGANSSIEFDGCGIGSAGWTEQTTPTFGALNSTLVVDGGTVATSAGADTAYYCISGTGGVGGMISFDSTTTATQNYGYVVTDANGTILGLPPGDMVDFTGAGPGECWVWGLSYTGNITAQAGDNATQVALSDGCFSLSNNFVVVFRDSVVGGTVTTEAGEDTVYYCVSGTGGPTSVFQFDSAGTAGPNFQYVVTDNNGTILGLPPGDMVDVGPAGTGECWVWGLSYTGNITAQAGDNATQVALSDGCFSLSNNFVVVFRDSVVGGTVATEAGEDTVYYCVSGTGGPTSVFQFDSAGTAGPNFQYVVTDNNGTILGLPPGDMVDVGPAGTGECWVWGLSYTGTITAQAGDNASQVALTDGCYSLSSNFVVIFRDSVVGGTVTTEAGEDTVYYCVSGTGGPTSVFQFDSAGTAGPNFQYVVTDNNGTILGLPPGDMVDVGPAGTGECWVWGLSYTGNITAQAGDNASQVALTDGCYSLSSNFVVIFRDSVVGGTVTTEAGEDTVYYCVSGTGGPTSVFQFDSAGTAGPNFQYVVTDNNGTILGLPPGDMVDVGPAGTGECWVWGLSYTGNITAQAGDNASQVALTDGCYSLSDNFVVIFRDSVVGGMVSIADTATEITICPGDGEADVVTFSTDGFSREGYQYIVTDDQGMILGLPGMPMVDFDSAGPGVCRVYGFAYTGDLSAMMGMELSAVTASGCFDLSENWITVDRDESTCTVNIRDLAETLELRISPVPAHNHLHVSLNLPEAQEISLEIVNLQGQSLLTTREFRGAGSQSFDLDIQSLPAGAYLVRVQAGTQQSWQRILKN